MADGIIVELEDQQRVVVLVLQQPERALGPALRLDGGVQQLGERGEPRRLEVDPVRLDPEARLLARAAARDGAARRAGAVRWGVAGEPAGQATVSLIGAPQRTTPALKLAFLLVAYSAQHVLSFWKDCQISDS